MHKSCRRFLYYTGWNVGSGLRDRLATKLTMTSRSFTGFHARQVDDEPGDADERVYDSANKLEWKNTAKNARAIKYDVRQLVYRRRHSSAESLLSINRLRNYKARGRDMTQLQKMMMMHKVTPERSRRFTDYKAPPISRSNPAPDPMFRLIEHQLRKAAGVDRGVEKMEIQDSQIPRLDESEGGSMDYLDEDFRESQDIYRPLRGNSPGDPMSSMPLSRPQLQAFYYVPPVLNQVRPDVHFAEWFIGITEAQLPFKVDVDGRPYFALHHPQMQFLMKIKSKMHFGRVDRTKEIYFVKDDKNLPRIIHLLNGNLYLQRSRDCFKEWVQRYKDLGVWQDEGYVFKETCCWKPQLNNKWLMGWIDSSYGLFAGRLVDSGTFPYFNIQLKFWLLSDDRSLLKHVKNIFGGGDIEKDGDLLRWTAREYKLHVRVNRYCRTFKPLSNKNINVTRYYRLVIYPLDMVHTDRARTKLGRLIDAFNKDERKWALAIKCHPYSKRHKQNDTQQKELVRSGATTEEVNAFKLQQEQKDFPFWNQIKGSTFMKGLKGSTYDYSGKTFRSGTRPSKSSTFMEGLKESTYDYSGKTFRSRSRARVWR